MGSAVMFACSNKLLWCSCVCVCACACVCVRAPSVLASPSVRRAAASISTHLSLMESPVARWGASEPPAEVKLGEMGLVGVVGLLGVSVLALL